MARETRTGEPREDLRDLGFGARVAELSRARLLNKDGSFNVTRRGLHWKRALSLYHEVMTMSWPRFYALLGLGYLLTNLAFAGAYLACGPGSLRAAPPTRTWPATPWTRSSSASRPWPPSATGV